MIATNQTAPTVVVPPTLLEFLQQLRTKRNWSDSSTEKYRAVVRALDKYARHPVRVHELSELFIERWLVTLPKRQPTNFREVIFSLWRAAYEAGLCTNTPPARKNGGFRRKRVVDVGESRALLANPPIPLKLRSLMGALSWGDGSVVAVSCPDGQPPRYVVELLANQRPLLWTSSHEEAKDLAGYYAKTTKLTVRIRDLAVEFAANLAKEQEVAND